MPISTRTSTRFPFTYNKNVGVSAAVFAVFKTLGFRFTMEVFQQGLHFPVSKLLFISLYLVTCTLPQRRSDTQDSKLATSSDAKLLKSRLSIA
jgi:hypothetical protein